MPNSMRCIRSVDVVVVLIQCLLLLLLLSVCNLAAAANQASGDCSNIAMCAGIPIQAALLPIPVTGDSCDSGGMSTANSAPPNLSLFCSSDHYMNQNQTLFLILNSTMQQYTVRNINYTTRIVEIDVSQALQDCSTPVNWTNSFQPAFSPSNPLLLHCDLDISSSAANSLLPNGDSCVVNPNKCGRACGGLLGFCCLQSTPLNDSTSYNYTSTLINSCQIYGSLNNIVVNKLTVSDLSLIDTTTIALQWAPGRSSNNQSVAIAGGVVGGVLGVSVVALVFCCFRRSGRIKPSVFKSKSAAHELPSAKAASYEYNKKFSSNSAGGAESLTRFFSYEELEQATNGFSAAMELGGGGFGTVYKGRLQDGRMIAVKKLNQDGRQGLQQFHNEVTVLSQVHHPNLVHLLGCCVVEVKRHALLVYEFVSNGSLAQHLHSSQQQAAAGSSSGRGGSSRNYLPWETRLNIAIQTSDALMYLHCLVEPPIFHRDVKSTNILLDSQFRAKVADFGLSRLVPLTFEMTHISTAPQGTPGYMDPDYHQSYQLSDKSDVYSFGVVLMELITAKKAVDMARDRKEINLASFAVAKIQAGTLDEIIDPHLKMSFDNVDSAGPTDDNKTRDMVNRVAELAFRCLATEKDDRPSMKEVLEELRRIRAHGYGVDPPNLANHDASSDTRLFGSLKEGEYIELDLSYGSVYNNNSNSKDTKPLITPERVQQQNSAPSWPRHSVNSEDDVWESVHSSPDRNSITQIWHEINLTNPEAR